MSQGTRNNRISLSEVLALTVVIWNLEGANGISPEACECLGERIAVCGQSVTHITVSETETSVYLCEGKML
jgi:hypothetical protein